jgi:hypothetical protein
MSDTPLEFYSDPRKKALDRLHGECFALEQEAKQFGWPEIQNALYRVRATEMAHAETFLRGQIRREVNAREEAASSVLEGGNTPYDEGPFTIAHEVTR